MQYPIGITGVVCVGKQVIIGWPEPHEYNLITNLRNKDSVREWFFDDRLLDVEENKIWLANIIRRPKDALLSIRFKKDDSFLGTIGWSDWNLRSHTAFFGRLSVDKSALKKIWAALPQDYCGVAIDSGIAIRDFAMENMGINTIKTYVFSNNTIALNVNQALGLVEVNRILKTKINGDNVEIIEMQLDKKKWKTIYKI
jgi:RimJ/RimL family protein N-acetyltransferase